MWHICEKHFKISYKQSLIPYTKCEYSEILIWFTATQASICKLLEISRMLQYGTSFQVPTQYADQL